MVCKWILQKNKKLYVVVYVNIKMLHIKLHESLNSVP